MATSLCAKKAAVRLITYSMNTGNIRASVLKIRNFSGYEDRDGSVGIPIFENQRTSGAISWPDEAMGPLNTPDHRFALPGNIGVSSEQKTPKRENVEPESDFLSGDSLDRQLTVVSQLIADSDFLDTNVDSITEMTDCILRKYFEKAKVELVIQDCPQIIAKDFDSFFPDMPSSGKLTVVTLTQRTENDMSGWSENVEEERNKLLENFMTTATEICHMLRVHNHWCDFVDPMTGQPHFGPYSNTTFYETDERYRHLGFQIEDLGCCKVIYHKKWGTKVFVGSIFTVAPKEHQVMQDLLRILK